MVKWNGTAWAPGADATGAGGSANVGTATLDFGAFPGGSDASVVVTGQTGIVAGSVVQARLRPAATADHSADEHLVETLRIEAGNIEAGSGFTIYGINSSQLNEPVVASRAPRSSGTGADPGAGRSDLQNYSSGGVGTRLYGQWSVAWSWN